MNAKQQLFNLTTELSNNKDSSDKLKDEKIINLTNQISVLKSQRDIYEHEMYDFERSKSVTLKNLKLVKENYEKQKVEINILKRKLKFKGHLKSSSSSSSSEKKKKKKKNVYTQTNNNNNNNNETTTKRIEAQKKPKKKYFMYFN